MRKGILSFILICLSIQAHAARTDCPIAKVKKVQIEGTKVMYQQEGAPWRTLGYVNNDDGTKERYSALLAAVASGKPVLVAYPIENYDCSKNNWSTAAFILRIYH